MQGIDNPAAAAGPLKTGTSLKGRRFAEAFQSFSSRVVDKTPYLLRSVKHKHQVSLQICESHSIRKATRLKMGSDNLSIRDRVEASRSSLGSKQRLVADYILANPTTILFVSVVEVAEHAEVDPATVMRFAKRLGLSGFPELRELLRNEQALPIRQAKDLLKMEQTISDADA